MQTFLLTLLLLSLIIPLHSIPTPLLHHPRFIKHSLRRATTTSPPQQYVEVTRPLPFDRLNSSCTLPILTHNFSNTYGLPPVSVSYSPPLNCTWSNVVLEIQVSCRGEQYDRIAAVWLSGAELIRTSTAEPTEDGVFWVVRKDVTRYSPLLAQHNLTLSVMLENIVNDVFTGVYQVNLTFHYYDTASAPVIALPGENANYYKSRRTLKSVDNPLNLEVNYAEGASDLYDRPADLIVPISSGGGDGFWFRIQDEWDIHSKEVGIPRNTYRAVLEVYSSSHGDDEFWYSNPPDAYLLNTVTGHRESGQKNSPDSYAETKKVKPKQGHGAYREVLVKIDKKTLVGSVVPFPVVFTGGINPLFWEPVVGIGAFDLPSYDLELTPFLGLILDGKLHSFSFEVANGIPFWLVDANLHLWLDAGASEVQAGIVSSEPEFSLERESKYVGGLDGKFEIETERKSKVSGWVNTSAGNLTTSYEQKLKFENTIEFYDYGTSKSVEQKVKDKSELTIKLGYGVNDLIVFRTKTTREYPLKLRSETLPGKEKDAYVMTTSLQNSIEEKKRVGDSSSTLKNKQDSSGWMSVKDHQVLSGVANTQQSYTFIDGSNCYSRNVAAENGTLVSDSTSLLCVSSV